MTLRLLAAGCLFLLMAWEKTPSPVQSGKSAAASAASQSTPVVTALAPGLWETKTLIDPASLTKLDDSATPADREIAETFAGRTITQAMCLSVDQARSPNATVIGGREHGQCSFESFSLNRGALDAVITCAREGQPGRTLIAAHGRYQGTQFNLDAVLRIEPDTPFDTVTGPMPKSERQPIRFHMKVTGTHKGECPAGEDVAQ